MAKDNKASLHSEATYANTIRRSIVSRVLFSTKPLHIVISLFRGSVVLAIKRVRPTTIPKVEYVQTKAWHFKLQCWLHKRGIAWHNIIRNECTCDFSCCTSVKDMEEYGHLIRALSYAHKHNEQKITVRNDTCVVGGRIIE